MFILCFFLVPMGTIYLDLSMGKWKVKKVKLKDVTAAEGDKWHRASKNWNIMK